MVSRQFGLCLKSIELDTQPYPEQRELDAKTNASFNCPSIAHFTIGLFSDDSRLDELKTKLPSTEATSQFKLCPIEFEKVRFITRPQFPDLLNFS